MSHHLYRHFDADGNLLYIGISMSAFSRFAQHKRTSSWSEDIVTMTIERFESREQLEAAERAAIFRENPLHNLANNQSECQSAHSKLVREALDTLGITQQQLADAINEYRGCSRKLLQSSISRWLRNNHDVPIEDAMAIHRVTNGKVDFFEFFPYLSEYMDVIETSTPKEAA